MPRRNPKPTMKRRPLMPANCDNKTRYATEAEAERIREQQELLNMSLSLRVYRCPIPGCGGWHLTRTTSPEN